MRAREGSLLLLPLLLGAEDLGIHGRRWDDQCLSR